MHELPNNPRNIIERADQLRAIASTTRHAICQIVMVQGEASVREIAYQLGRQPASLYKHIDRLLEVGLLRETGRVATGKREATTYASDKYLFKYAPEDPEMLEALIAVVHSEMRYAMRRIEETFRAGADGERPETNGPGRELYFSSYFAWLDADELAALNEHIDAVFEIMHKRPRREGTKLIAFQPTMFPMPTGKTKDAEKDA